MEKKILKFYKWAVLSGFLVWLAPFLIGIVLYPIHKSDRIFFETLMPVALSLTAVVFLSVKRTAASSFSRGFVLGAIWMAISIGLDLLMFMWGPMKMTFIDYMKDIGLTYLMLPIIAAGVGLVCGSAKPRAA